MRVLMIVSWYSPKDAEVMSAGVFHYEQSIALQKYCDTALYFPFDKTLSCEFSRDEEKGLLTYRRRPKERKDYKGNSLFEALDIMKDLKKICKEFKPDIIHAHCAVPTGFAAVLFGKLHGYPVMITEHSPIEQMDIHRKATNLRRELAYRLGKANICVSGDSRDRLKQLFPKCKYQIIYNGVMNPNRLVSSDVVYAKDGKINACIVAAFYSRDIKGYQFLLPAISQLKQQSVDIVLHICGGGEYLEHYQKLAKELEIEENCIFYGSCDREKVYSIVAQMDFNISSSVYECSGVSVQEAMLLGKPLVVTRSGGANSLVSEETAIVVDRESVDALVDGIKQMIRERKKFTSDVIETYAFPRFEIDQVSQAYMALYEKILNGKS